MSSTKWEWPDSVVTRVVDGDTFLATLTRDIGFNGKLTFQQRLRLNRINAAPKATEEGQAATAFVSSLLQAGPVHITTVGPYKYGDEWMAEVVLPDGRNVSDIMAASGKVWLWDGTGSRPGG